MLKPTTSKKTYPEYSALDDAFIQAPEPPAEGSDADVVQAYEAERKRYDETLARCRETESWRELAIEGREPTRFTMRYLTGDQLRKLQSLTVGGLLAGELAQLAFRCAVVNIENAGGLKITFENHPKLGPILHVDVTNAIDAIDSRIVDELGGLALDRGTGGQLTPHR